MQGYRPAGLYRPLGWTGVYDPCSCWSKSEGLRPLLELGKKAGSGLGKSNPLFLDTTLVKLSMGILFLENAS